MTECYETLCVAANSFWYCAAIAKLNTGRAAVSTSQNLSHLNALRTFEVVARHNSVRKAAKELGVTQAAVSHQIKKIEEYFGVSLFNRADGRFSPTPTATSILPKLQEGFESLSFAVQQLRAEKGRRNLRVSAPPSFAAKWLAPRLSRFLALEDGVDIQISATADLIAENVPPTAIAASLRQREVDVAIPFGRGRFPGCKAERLMNVSVVPLCSPILLEGEYALREPADLLSQTLLHDNTVYPEHPTWSDWFVAAGLGGVPEPRGP
jgi:LysR family transcriptional regulator, glycine cleavage system transcriptional activator